MSTLPRNEQQTIEDILEQIRKEAASQPLLRIERVRAAPRRTGDGAHEPAEPRAPVEAAHQPPRDALPPTAGPEWAWGGANREDLISHDDASPDLPSVLKRAADTAHSASVHTFPRTPRSRLTDALRRVRVPGSSTSTATEPVSAQAPGQTSDDLSRLAPATSPQAMASSNEALPVKRQMTSFLDTRFKKLSMPPAGTQPEAAADKVSDGASPASASQGEAAQLHALIEALSKTSPDALSRSQLGAAELLRPMLKQWLMENMPRIVERALSMEIAENTGRTANKKIV